MECPIEFRLIVEGFWCKQLYADEDDLIRVIGNFCSDNSFTLYLDDNEEEDHTVNFRKASMIIVEPYILIPTTTITKAFPCVRKAYID